MMSRRTFVEQTVMAATALGIGVVCRAEATSARVTQPLRLLVLGGTGFIGPHHVQAPMDRGHKVAVFNRGKGGTDLPVGVERLIGDYSTHAGRDLLADRVALIRFHRGAMR